MITELRTFIAVVRHGTFAAAGERIGLTQSAVSSQIKRLEESLGVELFDRTRRAATLNPVGALTLERAEEIIALYSKLGESPGERDSVNTLRIGAISSVQSLLLPRALSLMSQKYPKLRFNLVPGVSMRLMDQLDAGEIDLAITIRPPFGMLPELSWQALVHEPFMLLVPRTVKGADWRVLIESQPFLRYDRKSFGGRLVERFLREQQLDVQDLIEADEIQGLIQLVANGLGVAVIPMVDAYLPLPHNVRAVSLGGATFYRDIGILLPKAKAFLPIFDQLVHCLRDTATTTAEFARHQA